jgi:unspecific monooxygenase
VSLPGPERFGLWGLARFVFEPVALLRELQAEHGDSLLLPGRPPMVWLGEPDAVRDLFAADPEVLVAGAANEVMEGVLGRHSMFLLDGAAHKRERRLVMPAFHGARMRAWTADIRKTARDAVSRWEPGNSFSFLEAMQGVTLEVIARNVLGLDGARNAKPLTDRLRALIPLAQDPMLFLLATTFGSMRVRKLLDRWPAFIPIPGAKMARLLRELDGLLRAEFAERRRLGAQGTDVLSMLLGAQDESGQGLSDEALRDETITLLIAGHDTSAIALCWALHHLYENRAVLARLRQEIDCVAASDDALASLPYLDAVVQESMRLAPLVPVIQRIARAPVRLGRYEVPAGALVMAHTWAIHSRQEIYPEPEQFRPERFLEKRFAPHEYFPFGGGARRCAGAAFALLSTKLVLAEVVRHAELEVQEPVTLQRRGVLLAPSNGLRVRCVGLR